jgi:hypothetical protein
VKIRALDIRGFRGIKAARLIFADHDVLIGPNGCGKSTIIDALSLTFGRSQLVRELTEHDFFGSDPGPATRIRIIVTLTGFGEDPDDKPDWFRSDRAVPKWWNEKARCVDPQPSDAATELCLQLGFAARFDREELCVEHTRYFHDDDVEDPFLAQIVQIPGHLLREIGFYVLPVRRTWEGNASFASELFRKAVMTAGGLPAEPILEERDRLRKPAKRLECEGAMKPLVERVNGALRQLLPHAPEFQLRVTATDSEALLRALVPHYQAEGQPALPAARHGTGLLALQLFFLLLEIGRARVKENKSFILALEEPELHIPPGLQRRLIAQAMSAAGQTICTSHAPRIASFFPAPNIRVLTSEHGALRAAPLLERSLGTDASQIDRKLYQDDRPRTVEALMHFAVLVPEGRNECEWLRLLSDAVETGEQVTSDSKDADTPPFGSVVGIAPTPNGEVAQTYSRLRSLRDRIVTLVDGDAEGNKKVSRLAACDPPPDVVLQWPAAWTIENAIGWILGADEERTVRELPARLARPFSSVKELEDLFRVKNQPSRLGGNYIAYEEVVAFIREDARFVARAREILDWVTQGCLGRDGPHMERAAGGSRLTATRFRP